MYNQQICATNGEIAGYLFPLLSGLSSLSRLEELGPSEATTNVEGISPLA